MTGSKAVDSAWVSMPGVSRSAGDYRPVSREEGSARIIRVKDRHWHTLFARPGVTGHGIGLNEAGDQLMLWVNVLGEQYVPSEAPWSLDAFRSGSSSRARSA